jgi:hypothetical protein
LRRALAESLSTAEHARALAFLGATEVFRGPWRRDSAEAAFRRLILLDPRRRLDPLVFPPRVLALFEEVRQATKAVRLEPRSDEGGFAAAVYATSPHELEARIVREDGRLVRMLYRGPTGDSLELRWNGRDAENAYVPSGRYLLRVASRASARGRVIRQVQLALETELVVSDTLPWPAPLAASHLLPETKTQGAGFRSLMLGLAAGGTALVLPAVVANGSEPSGARFVVAGAVSLAGIVGLVTQPGRSLPRNVAANQRRRDEWRREFDAVVAENARRRAAIRFTARPGTLSVIDVAEEP